MPRMHTIKSHVKTLQFADKDIIRDISPPDITPQPPDISPSNV